jgi:4-alpha-glucanotransferase
VRRLGVVLPLFSLRRTRSEFSRGFRDWGIGDFGALSDLGSAFRNAGCTTVQVLPPHPLGGHETSPYGARSAFALDPLYLDLDALSGVPASVLGSPGEVDAERVQYAQVRKVKGAALSRALDWFLAQGKHEEPAVQSFLERAWVRRYGEFAALSEQHQGASSRTWTVGAEAAEPRAVLRHQLAQYLCDQQWQSMRSQLRNQGLTLMGDVPFILGADSADVWSLPAAFRHDVSLGCPPDPFSATGQDWSLPAYDFSDGASALAFLRARATRASELYDLYRVDHVVGYFRQWQWRTPTDGAFDIMEEGAQMSRGRALLECMQSASSREAVIAEDLGVIPDFVRSSLNELGIPGYKVIPWERDAHGLRDPRTFTPTSVTTYGTHDTEPVLAWVRALPEYERNELVAMAGALPTESQERALLRLAMESGSDLTLLLFQELLGLSDRINTPGTVSARNWTLRIPDVLGRSETDDRFGWIRELAEKAGR